MAKTIRTLWPNIFDEATITQNTNGFGFSEYNYSIIFQQKEDAEIKEICLLNAYSAIGNTPPGTVKVGLMGVDSAGYADRNYVSSGTAYTTFNDWSSLSYLKMYSLLMPENIYLSGGMFYSLNIESIGASWFPDGDSFAFFDSVTASNNSFAFPYYTEAFSDPNDPLIYSPVFKQNTSNRVPVFALRSDTKTYGSMCFEEFIPVDVAGTLFPSEIGLKFKAPKSWGKYFYISGVKLFYLQPSITFGNFSADLIIYDSDGITKLQSTKIYLEQKGENASPKTGQRIGSDSANYFFSGDLIKLKTGKDYYFGFNTGDEELSGLTPFTFYYFQYNVPQDQTWLNEETFTYCERIGSYSTTWDEYPDRVLQVQFYIDQIVKTPKVFNLT